MCDILSDVSQFLEHFSSRTPADAKQEVNFLESSETSLHKRTVNLKKEDEKADLARRLSKLSTFKQAKRLVYVCICALIIQQLKKRKSLSNYSEVCENRQRICFKVESLLESGLLGQNFGLCAAAGEEDPLGQLVEELDGSSRQLCQTPDGSCMNLLENQHSHQNHQKQI